MIAVLLRRLSVALFAALLSLAAVPAAAQEDPDRIPRFAADIVVQENGDFLVTEVIDFEVMPGSEKHGIYRDFPTNYRDALGFNTRVGFEVLEVSRDGAAEPYVLFEGSAGMRVRIGRENVLLQEGVHRYRLVYRTDNQLLFHSNRDEVYWNVTGNDWAHPIDQAEATVHLPPGAYPRENAAYTGYAGEDGRDYTKREESDGTIVFATTRSLQPGEGLTIAVAFPKGYVAEPGFEARMAAALGDNLGLPVAVLGLLATFLYFYTRWRAVGRDPEAGIVVPRFEAPEGLSPAGTGYVWARCRGTAMARAKAFTVALTSLAIKGRLTIEEDGKDYILEGRPREAEAAEAGARLPAGEAAALSRLFPVGDERVEINGTYDSKIEAAAKKVMDALSREHAKVYFLHNTWHWLGGLAIALVGIAAALTLQYGDIEYLFIVGFGIVFIGGFTTPAALIAYKLAPLWGSVLRGEMGHLPAALFASAFVVPFFIPALGSVYLIFEEFGLLLALTTAGQVALVVLFWFLMKAPTTLGREVRDAIEGYRLYLSVAEGDRLNMLTSEPKMTVELFEHHLPYAMALDVEKEWSRRFSKSADAATQEAAQHSRRWYRAHDRHRGLSSLAPALSSGLSRTLSSAATPPSKSGGSSGGGSSGGGGGGGGGGSW